MTRTERKYRAAKTRVSAVLREHVRWLGQFSDHSIDHDSTRIFRRDWRRSAKLHRLRVRLNRIERRTKVKP